MYFVFIVNNYVGFLLLTAYLKFKWFIERVLGHV